MLNSAGCRIYGRPCWRARGLRRRRRMRRRPRSRLRSSPQRAAARRSRIAKPSSQTSSDRMRGAWRRQPCGHADEEAIRTNWRANHGPLHVGRLTVTESRRAVRAQPARKVRLRRRPRGSARRRPSRTRLRRWRRAARPWRRRVSSSRRFEFSVKDIHGCPFRAVRLCVVELMAC